MNDLISRISLKQSIAVSAILKDKKTLDQIIDEEPTIDAVPVIRCKDCKHWTTMVERPKHGTCDQWCTLNVTRRDEYCSKAERKEE